jgi:hypothetical protein
MASAHFHAVVGDREGARKAYQNFPLFVEGRRPLHSHSEGSQGGVCKAAMNLLKRFRICFRRHPPASHRSFRLTQRVDAYNPVRP